MTRLRSQLHTAVQNIDALERCAIVFLFSTFVVLVGLYMYFVARAAYATADRRAFTHESVSLEGDIAVLEGRYLSVRQSVTLEGAYAFGLTDAATVRYIARDDHGTALSLEVR